MANTSKTTPKTAVQIAREMRGMIEKLGSPQDMRDNDITTYERLASELVDVVLTQDPRLEAARQLIEDRWQDVNDLLCSGLESGSMATFGIDMKHSVAPTEFKHYAMKAEPGEKQEIFKHLDYPMNPGGSAALFNRHQDEYDASEPDADPAPWVTMEKIKKTFLFRLDLDCIARGLVAMQEKAPNAYGDFLAGNGDAFTGDAFLQCCIFGSCIYG